MCVSLGLVRIIPESRFLVLFLACVFSLNPIFELLLGRGHTKQLSKVVCQSLGLSLLWLELRGVRFWRLAIP